MGERLSHVIWSALSSRDLPGLCVYVCGGVSQDLLSPLRHPQSQVKQRAGQTGSDLHGDLVLELTAGKERNK